MKHQAEICRWSKTQDGTKVWVKDLSGRWYNTMYPQWSINITYIVDDEWAELRKAQADGKTIEINDNDKGWIVQESEYEFICEVEDYRIKPDEPTCYYQWERLDMNNDSVIIVSSVYLTDLEAVNLKYAEQGWRRIDSSKRTWEK